MQSKAVTVEQYLAELPPDRRSAIEAVRAVIRKNLDPAYREGVGYGMIGYVVPHEVFPQGYHCDPSKPLMFAALGSQKNYMSLYMMSVCTACEDDQATPDARWFKEAWAKTGKKLDMGKSCIRFKAVEDLALDVIGEAIRRTPAKKYVEGYLAVREQVQARPVKGPPKKAATKKTARKSTGKSRAARR